MLELKKGNHCLVIQPECGGVIKSWKNNDQEVLHSLSSDDKESAGEGYAGRPLLPFVGPLSHSEFSFGGEEYQLHSAPMVAWDVAHQSKTHLILTHTYVPSQEREGLWPFAYRAALSYALRDDGLDVSLVIENRDERAQPVGLGFKTVIAPSDKADIVFSAEKIWALKEGGFVCGEPSDMHKNGVDFSEKKLFSKCGRSVETSMVRVEMDSIFQHVILGKSDIATGLCVEPMTQICDALNRFDIPERGGHVLKPGERIGGDIRFRVPLRRRVSEE